MDVIAKAARPIADMAAYGSRDWMAGGSSASQRPAHCDLAPVEQPIPVDVRFSNRRFGVKRFQTIRHHSVDVTRGLVLLFGIGA